MSKRELRATYDKIRKGFLLSPMRMQVYQFIYKHGPSTTGEINASLATSRTGNPSYHRRLAEMEELDVVRRVRSKCRATGRVVDRWHLTGRLPRATSVPRYPKGILKETLYLGLEEIFFLIHRFRRLNPEYSAPKHLTDLCMWLGRRGMGLAKRDAKYPRA